MAKITQKELLDRYGISLPKGKYDIVLENKRYKIYTVKDDTEGCLLLGLNRVKGAVLNSKDALNFFMARTPDEFTLTIE